MKKIFALLLLLVLVLTGCEKDDICSADTSTTPRLVIEFYDQGSRETLKSVTSMTVQAVGSEAPIVFDATKTDSTKYLVTATSIKIPFDPANDSVTYALTLNANNETFRNTDTIKFNYQRQNVFISRACGFSTLFALDRSADLGPYAITTDDNLWIKDIDVVTYNLTTENETHLRIYL